MGKWTLILGLLLASTAFSQDIPTFETVVEDVVFNTSSRIVIDEKTIKDSQAPDVTSLLATEANISISSSNFQSNSVYIRGGDAGHVLIIIDGIPFYDASTSRRTLNLNSVDIRSVRRIEVIKGSQTVLYGGQALSGVIKIDTIPKDFNSQSTIQARLGTQDARDLSFLNTQELKPNHALIIRGHGSWKNADSPVLDSTRTYEQNNASGELTYAWHGGLEGHVKANFLQDQNFTTTTTGTAAVADTDDFEQFSRQFGVSSVIKFNEMPWTPRLGLGVQTSNRTIKQPMLPINPTGSDEYYDANLHNIRLDFTPLKTDRFNLLAGLSYNMESFIFKDNGVQQFDKTLEQKGIYVKADYTLHQNVIFTIGGRAETWNGEDALTTHQLGLTLFKNTKLEYSNGYKIPSLHQLYSKSYGNATLKEEKAQLYSLTQDIEINENQNISVTFFASEFNNLIVYSIVGTEPITNRPIGMNMNVSRAQSRGVEASYILRTGSDSSYIFTYGYQEPKDLDRNTWLNNRPLVNGAVRYMTNWNRHSGSMELQGQGQRYDRFRADVRTLPGYMTANASYSYNFDNGFMGHLRLNNLMDHRYQESDSYYSEGFSALAGAEYTF